MAQEMKGKILITQEQILKRAEELGKQITEDYKGEELVLVGTLRGAVPWMGIQSFELFFFLWLSVWNGQFTDQ